MFLAQRLPDPRVFTSGRSISHAHRRNMNFNRSPPTSDHLLRRVFMTDRRGITQCFSAPSVIIGGSDFCSAAATLSICRIARR